MQLHDPFTGTTPSQRLAAAARSMRLGRIAANAKRTPLPVGSLEPVPGPPFSFNEWVRRQEQLHPFPKAPWFSIISEISRKLTIKDIQRAVSRFYHVTMNDIICERRQGYLIKPRQVAMFLSKDLTPHSLPEIGRRFGGRDHTTVLSAVRKIARLLPLDADLAGDVALLSETLVPS